MRGRIVRFFLLPLLFLSLLQISSFPLLSKAVKRALGSGVCRQQHQRELDDVRLKIPILAILSEQTGKQPPLLSTVHSRYTRRHRRHCKPCKPVLHKTSTPIGICNKARHVEAMITRRWCDKIERNRSVNTLISQ